MLHVVLVFLMQYWLKMQANSLTQNEMLDMSVVCISVVTLVL